MRNLLKVIKVSEVVKLLKDGDIVVFSGFGLVCVNEEMVIVVEKCFLEEGVLCNLIVMYVSVFGDCREKGMSYWGYEGLIKCWIGGIVIVFFKMVKLIEEDKCEVYNLL